MCEWATWRHGDMATWRDQMLVQLRADKAPFSVFQDVGDWIWAEFAKAMQPGLEMPCPKGFEITWSHSVGLILHTRTA
ncbi:hypothetical protein AVO44_15895 [Ruegeria profundi]|uniref:Uncharacterized protein n=2 Tax=Ruegeria profundi TaxID=1685378 RepID=A0A0X3TQ02_9RHOB|nr:hypothetical protein AVO44_15895 [Ruegeria profundi]